MGVPCSTNRFSVLETCMDTDCISNICSSTSCQRERMKDAPVLCDSDQLHPNFLIRNTTIRKSTELSIQLESISSHHPMGVSALLDSGATGLFIDIDFVHAKNFTTTKLAKPIPVYNIDGSLNNHGSVKETLDLIVRFKNHTERATFYVTALGGVPV